jgi:hypothetical protein
MRIPSIVLLLVLLLVCSCSTKRAIQVEIGDYPSWITQEQTRKIGLEFIARKGYTNAVIVVESGGHQFFEYHYATNNAVLPITVLVDRKTSNAKFVSECKTSPNP